MSEAHPTQITFNSHELLVQPLPKGFDLSMKEGVYTLSTFEFQNKLDAFLEVFKEWTEFKGEVPPKPEEMDQLPEGIDNHTWRSRSTDWNIIKQYLSTTKREFILETGSWNGWLANKLTQGGHDVVAIDYFLESPFGLMSRKHYKKADWLSVQLDIAEIDILQPQFDTIIFNRNLPYCPGVKNTLNKAMKLIIPGGKIILTGLNIVSKPKKIEKYFEEAERFFSGRGVSLYLKNDFKKYLDTGDLDLIKDLGFSIHPYSRNFKSQLASFIKPNATQHYWAILTK